MKLYRSGAFLFAVAAASFGVAQRPAVIDQTAINIKMSSGSSGAVVDAVIGAREISSRAEIGWRTVKLPTSVSVSRAMDYYKRASGVLAVEPRILRELDFNPNDTSYSTQYAPQIVKANLAWDLTRGASSTIVAILDTGIDFTHPEFQGTKLVKGYDVSNDDSDPTDDLPFASYVNHGIHCAGIAAASTNNGVGISGMGFNCSIMPVKVFPNSFSDVIAKGIVYATNNGAKVVSMSLGSYRYSQEEQDAVNYAYNRNVIVVASAGNDNVDTVANPHYPSDYTNVVSTGSTDRNDRKSGFSNWGKRVDIAAPGSDILSTFGVANGSYGELSGTSMATPAVAGIFGLVWAYAPAGTRNSEIISVMKKTADPVGTWLSNGRINAYKLVDAFTASTPIAATVVSKSAFQGTPVTGPGAVMNIRSLAAQGVGQIAAMSAVLRMPNMPVSQLRKSATTFTFGASAAGTAQLFLWNYSTRKYDMVVSTPGSAGRISFETGAFPSQYYEASTRNYSVIVRMLVPSRSGNSAAPFVFPIHTMNGLFSYRNNP